MAFFIPPNQCLLFFSDPKAAFTPERMKQVLADDDVSSAGDGEPFTLQWSGGPKLYASIVRGEVPAVLVLRLLGKGRKHRELATASDTYIEIKFDSLDEVLDEINTLIVVQSSLQKATRGLMYRGWNRSFSGPVE